MNCAIINSSSKVLKNYKIRVIINLLSKIKHVAEYLTLRIHFVSSFYNNYSTKHQIICQYPHMDFNFFSVSCFYQYMQRSGNMFPNNTSNLTGVLFL